MLTNKRDIEVLERIRDTKGHTFVGKLEQAFLYGKYGLVEGGMVLDVPWISQWGPGADYSPSDCGPACCAMVCQYLLGKSTDVDKITVGMGLKPGEYAFVSSLMQYLSYRSVEAKHYGEYNYYRNGALTIERIRQAIAASHPVIALVYYGLLPPERPKGFRGWHYVVVTGYTDDHVIINDPYWRVSGGQAWPIPNEVFTQATGGNGGNQKHQGLECMRRYE